MTFFNFFPCKFKKNTEWSLKSASYSAAFSGLNALWKVTKHDWKPNFCEQFVSIRWSVVWKENFHPVRMMIPLVPISIFYWNA